MSDEEVRVEAVESISLEDVAGALGTGLALLGQAIAKAIQDTSELMIIHTDAESRRCMDMMVEAGAARNRREAAEALVRAGVQAKQPLFARIERTRAQIAELRRQVKAMVGQS